MEEKELKTSLKQRIVILAICIIMLVSLVAGYALVILNGGGEKASGSSKITAEKIAEYEASYNEKLAKFQEVTKSDFEQFDKYRSEIKAYNETAANEGSVETRDLLKGTGRKLEDGDYNYLAYYVGWCGDETIFDSSLDDATKPTGFTKALDASQGMIEGWNIGVEGMRLGGIREITVPGQLAYGEQLEICGGYNKPLKFLVMAVENKGAISELAADLDLAYMKWQYANYGIDYEAQIQQ